MIKVSYIFCLEIEFLRKLIPYTVLIFKKKRWVPSEIHFFLLKFNNSRHWAFMPMWIEKSSEIPGNSANYKNAFRIFRAFISSTKNSGTSEHAKMFERSCSKLTSLCKTYMKKHSYTPCPLLSNDYILWAPNYSS